VEKTLKVKFWIELGSEYVEQILDIDVPKNYTEEDIKEAYNEWIWDVLSGAWEVVKEESQAKALD
jgi:hypothetical protein